MNSWELDYYERAYTCEKCGNDMIFKGVGEYQCEKCNHIMYDDYGKVRLYIETHRGATAAEVESNTGVSQKAIRRMLRESRLEIAEESKLFLFCEICKKAIRSGTLCTECTRLYGNKVVEKTGMKHSLHGYSTSKPNVQDGEKRFIRKDSK